MKTNLFVRTLIAACFLGGLTFGLPFAGPVRAQTDAQAMAPVPANAPFAKEINAFTEADKKQMPPEGAVLFIGSSTIRIWKTLAQDFKEIPVINRGFGGSFLEQSTRYADRIVIPYKPKMIVLFAGTNDIASGKKSPQQVCQDYQDFVAKVHAALPDTRIVYLSISPTVARWKLEGKMLEANYLIEKFTVEHNSPTRKLSFINSHSQLLTLDGLPPAPLLQKDGLHLNPDGYKALVGIVKPRILALAQSEGVLRIDTPFRPEMVSPK